MSARQPTYNVLTYDGEIGDYTPQRGAGRSTSITLRQVRRVLRRLRSGGYSAHRVRYLPCRQAGRDGNGYAHDSDPSVLVERVWPPVQQPPAWRARKGAEE